jgi:hypothetical protein
MDTTPNPSRRTVSAPTKVLEPINELQSPKTAIITASHPSDTPFQPGPLPPDAGLIHHPPRLLWHTCHLTNILSSQLSAYLSLEAIGRNTLATNLSIPISAIPLKLAQAAMIRDAAQNLFAATDALQQTALHRRYMQDVGGLRKGPAYRSMMVAVAKTGDVIRKSSFFIPAAIAECPEGSCTNAPWCRDHRLRPR